MPRLIVPLPDNEWAALLRKADRNLRTPQDEAHFILRDDLQRDGLLPTDTTTPTTAQAAQHDAG